MKGLEHEQPANVLVCVTDQPSCRRLIVAGVSIAKKLELPLKVVCVRPEGLVSAKTAEALQVLYNISSKLGADMTVYFNGDPALTVAVHARQINAVHIVSGTPGANSSLFIETVKGLLPELPLSIVDADEHIVTFPGVPSPVSQHAP